MKFEVAEHDFLIKFGNDFKKDNSFYNFTLWLEYKAYLYTKRYITHNQYIKWVAPKKRTYLFKEGQKQWKELNDLMINL